MTVLSGEPILASDATRIVATPTATSTNGTATATNSAVEVKDAVLGDHTVNLVAGARYRVNYVGVKISLDTSANVVSIRLRIAQTTSPTISSTLLIDWSTRVNAVGGAGQESQNITKTFTVANTDTYKIGAFTQTAAVVSQEATPVGDRELYVEILSS